MTPGVSARDLRVTRGGGTAVDGVDLDVGPGEVAVLAGPSGSGKSSLLLAVAGLLGPDPAATVQGDVSIAGLDPREAPAREVARRVGVLFQRPRDQLLALDVGTEVVLKLQRLGVPPAEVPGRVGAALERVGAAHLASRGTATLSGGEAKRVALAQALAGDPDVLLLDEPLADLDPEGRDRVVDLVSDLADGTAVLVAEHRLDALSPAADRVVGLRDGARAPLDDATPEPPAFDEAPPAGPTLRLEGVTASPGDEPALADLDVALPPGLTCVAGPNGAGKTTLLRVVAGLLEPEAGTVRLGGDPLVAPAHERARRVGYAPQHPDAVFHRPTVEDEIAWGPRNLGASCDPAAVAEAHRLGPHRGRHPHTLSGGEAERLAWAAAHAHDPPVRLLDEPTTGLDPAARRVLARRLGRARRRGHALVATHDPWLLAAADRVLLLGEAGPRLGPPEDVLEDPTLPAREAGAAPARRVHP